MVYIYVYIQARSYGMFLARPVEYKARQQSEEKTKQETKNH